MNPRTILAIWAVASGVLGLGGIGANCATTEIPGTALPDIDAVCEASCSRGNPLDMCDCWEPPTEEPCQEEYEGRCICDGSQGECREG